MPAPKTPQTSACPRQAGILRVSSAARATKNGADHGHGSPGVTKHTNGSAMSSSAASVQLPRVAAGEAERGLVTTEAVADDIPPCFSQSGARCPQGSPAVLVGASRAFICC